MVSLWHHPPLPHHPCRCPRHVRTISWLRTPSSDLSAIFPGLVIVYVSPYLNVLLLLLRFTILTSLVVIHTSLINLVVVCLSLVFVPTPPRSRSPVEKILLIASQLLHVSRPYHHLPTVSPWPPLLSTPPTIPLSTPRFRLPWLHCCSCHDHTTLISPTIVCASPTSLLCARPCRCSRRVHTTLTSHAIVRTSPTSLSSTLATLSSLPPRCLTRPYHHTRHRPCLPRPHCHPHHPCISPSETGHDNSTCQWHTIDTRED
jgi:hypothetical protein